MNDTDTQASQEGVQSAPAERNSVFFVSLPKSGTVFTWYSLEGVTGLKMPRFHEMDGWPEYNGGLDFSVPELYACGDYNTQMLLPEGMKNFGRGYIFGSHMQASYHNMRVLKEAGIDKVSVLLRDPRDAFVSWVYHLARLGPSARDYHSKIYHIPRAYYDWPLARQFEYQIRTFLPVTVNWLESWLDYYASSDRAVEVLFVYFDELMREPLKYIRRIADFHGIRQIDESKIVVAEPGKMHFRKGEHGQWKEEFTPADQELAENLMGNRILDGFDAAASSHPALVHAQDLLASGDARAAAASALAAITEFPNHRPAYELVLRAAGSAGADTSALERLIASTLSQRDVASTFVYRHELVEECRRLCSGMA
jgi:hypothetical protein